MCIFYLDITLLSHSGLIKGTSLLYFILKKYYKMIPSDDEQKTNLA